MTDNSLEHSSAAVVDEIGLHMAAAGGIDRAAVPLGLFLAWLVNLDLVSRAFARQHETALLRVKYRELSGSEMLVSACAGRLYWEDLNERGRGFVETFYPNYWETFVSTFETQGSDAYLIADNWENYDRISRVLTAQLMGAAEAQRQATAGQGKRKHAKRWWSPW